MASPNVPLNLLPSKLKKTGTNYREWKASAIYLIQRQGLIGFIDGSYSHDPSDDETVRSPGYDVWRRIDEPLMDGILSLLEKEVADVVKHLNTSRKIWKELEKKFDTESVVEGHHIITVRDWKEYYPVLHEAALSGDWNKVKEIFDMDASAMTAKLNSTQSTVLHLAIESQRRSIEFVANLVELLPADALIAAKDALGDTALGIAASVGDEEAAILLVNKNPNLVYITNNLGDFPVHTAAKHGKKSVLEYLISVTKDDRDQNPYAALTGLALLISTIEADILDIALNLVQKYPYLARLRLSSNSALKSIAESKFRRYRVDKPKTSSRLSREDIKERKPIRRANPDGTTDDDMESAMTGMDMLRQVIKEREAIRLNIHDDESDELLVRSTLLVQILKCLFQEMKTMSTSEGEDMYRDPIMIAAKLDNWEVVSQIVVAFPNAISCSNPASFQNISHVAVEHRASSVLRFIRKRIKKQHQYFDLPDINGNTLLHLAAQSTPSHLLAKHSNPFKRMQRELKWYKEVERLVRPRCGEQLNHAGKSPTMIFEEEHKSLREEANEWVKATVNSGLVTAALISTISFAAAITVPGGSNSTGYPLFGKNSVFTFFAVSDAISIIASATSLMIFVRVSISGRSNKDYLTYIPSNLTSGTLFLFVSIITMMFAFSATLYLVFGHKHKWVLILTVIVAAYMVLLFLFAKGIRNITDE